VERERVTVELYGIPRQRAGRAELAVPVGTMAEVLTAVADACPGLNGLVEADGRLSPHYLISIDGRRFVTDLSERLSPRERMLILSADSGG
jgi:hypothetical protein